MFRTVVDIYIDFWNIRTRKFELVILDEFVSQRPYWDLNKMCDQSYGFNRKGLPAIRKEPRDFRHWVIVISNFSIREYIERIKEDSTRNVALNALNDRFKEINFN